MFGSVPQLVVSDGSYAAQPSILHDLTEGSALITRLAAFQEAVRVAEACEYAKCRKASTLVTGVSRGTSQPAPMM